MSQNPKKHDEVNPSHYKPTTKGKYARLQVIDIIEMFKLSFALGNALKYILRCGKKPIAKKITDLEKAIWYLKRELKNVKS